MRFCVGAPFWFPHNRTEEADGVNVVASPARFGRAAVGDEKGAKKVVLPKIARALPTPSPHEAEMLRLCPLIPRGAPGASRETEEFHFYSRSQVRENSCPLPDVLLSERGEERLPEALYSASQPLSVPFTASCRQKVVVGFPFSADPFGCVIADEKMCPETSPGTAAIPV